MAAPLKQAFDENVDRIRRERLPGELAYALKQLKDRYKTMKHTDIRAAVLDALEQTKHGDAV